MRTLLVAGLVVSLAARAQSADVYGHPPFSEPQVEAIEFDSPRVLLDIRDVADGGVPRVAWTAPAGTCLTTPAVQKIDDRLKNFERKEAAAVDSRKSFFLGGLAVGGTITTIAAVLVAVFGIKH